MKERSVFDRSTLASRFFFERSFLVLDAEDVSALRFGDDGEGGCPFMVGGTVAPGSWTIRALSPPSVAEPAIKASAPCGWTVSFADAANPVAVCGHFMPHAQKPRQFRRLSIDGSGIRLLSNWTCAQGSSVDGPGNFRRRCRAASSRAGRRLLKPCKRWKSRTAVRRIEASDTPGLCGLKMQVRR